MYITNIPYWGWEDVVKAKRARMYWKCKTGKCDISLEIKVCFSTNYIPIGAFSIIGTWEVIEVQWEEADVT